MYFDTLVEHCVSKRLQRAKKARTGLSLHADESTDRGAKSLLVLCGTYFDDDWKFRAELLGAFDCSRKGDTAGASIEKTVVDFLNKHGLLGLADFLCNDGASNVNDYPCRGKTNSYAALFVVRKKQLAEKIYTWWCLPHRLNLALGDTLKECKINRLISLLRTLSSWMKSSSQKYTALADGVAQQQKERDDFAELLLQMERATRELERRVLGNDEASDEDKEAYAEKKKELDDGKIQMEEFERDLKVRYSPAQLAPSA